MNPLKLVTNSDVLAPHDHAPSQHDASPARPDRLPFPTAAVHVMNRQRIGRLTTRVQSERDPLHALEAQINKQLDRAQELVNQLREDVDSFKFPGHEDDHSPRPRAA